MVATALKRIASVRVPSGAPEKSQGVWKTLLEGAARAAEFEKSTFLILGQRDAGKAHLVRALQKIGSGGRKMNEMENFGEADAVAGLDYAYLNVRSVDDADLSEILTKTDVWFLQDAHHKELLLSSITPSQLKHMVVLICLDLSEPWTLRNQLRHWLDFASDLIEQLLKNIPVEEQEALRLRLNNYIQNYRAMAEGGDIQPSSLQVNLGVPVVVCICKSDFSVNLDTRNSPGRADVVMAHLRRLCLPYGAALIYCCTKSPLSSRNLELIYRYCLHRVYDFKFVEHPVLAPPDSIFFPSGWDTEAEIQEFALKTVGEGFETPLEALLPPPPEPTTGITASDESSDLSMDQFLEGLVAKDQTLLVSDIRKTSTRPRKESAPAPTARVPRTSRPDSVPEATTSRGPSTRRQVEATTARGGDTESLRAFFQTLLTKPPQPTARPASPRRDSDKHSSDEVRVRRSSSRPAEKEDVASPSTTSTRAPSNQPTPHDKHEKHDKHDKHEKHDTHAKHDEPHSPPPRVKVHKSRRSSSSTPKVAK